MNPLISPNEIVDSVISLLAIPVLYRVVSVRPRREARAFSLAYLFMLCALAATITEGFIWAEELDVVEHLLYAAAGIAFLTAMILFPRLSHTERDSK